MKGKRGPLKVGFIALGCPKNIVDSEKMLGEIAEAGFLITGEAEDADVIVVNTCGFIEPAKVEAIEAIKEAVEYKHNFGVKKVIVAGCLPQRLGKELFKEVDGIDAIVGLGERDEISQIIEKTFNEEQQEAYLGHFFKLVHDDTSRLLITPSHSVYLRISEGCDHKCSFCTIPAIRGKFRSKPLQNIIAEASELVNAGAVEINLIAQDTAYYGKEMKMKNGLVKLLEELEKIDGLKWIRLLYLYPVGFNEHFIETVAKSEKIVHYFDIPIQHVNNQILKAMRRPDTKEKLYKLIEDLRAAMPDSVLRTTVIVGFPGETDEQFDELIEFLKWVRFDALGAFKYYAESGTEAAQMPNQISEKIKEVRLEELMLSQQQIAFAQNKERIGKKLICLVDSIEGRGKGRGRFYGQGPEIDSICLIKKCKAKIGEFINTRVVKTQDYDLIVEQI